MPLSRLTAALIVGAATLMLVSAPAAAERTYSVRIDSDPSRATIYLGSKDRDPLGETPYRGRLPAGRHTIIVERDGYISQVQEIRVKKQSRVQNFDVALARMEKGSISVRAGRSRDKGARIFIDGKDVGNVPDTIAVPAGPHQVEVKREGYRTFETWVEVKEGRVTKVTIKLVSRDGDAGGDDRGRDEPYRDDEGDYRDDEGDYSDEEGDYSDDEGDYSDEEGDYSDEEGDYSDEEGDEDRDSEADVDGEASKATKVPLLAASAGVAIAGRQFRFLNPTRGDLRPYDAPAVPLVRIAVEAAPLASMGNKILAGLTLRASYARAAPLNSSARINGGQSNEAEVSVPTLWSELDIGLGYRHHFAKGKSYFGLMAGYGAHNFTFTYDATSDQLQGSIPDVSYRYISAIVDGRFAVGTRYAALVFGGPRLVQAIGDLGTRFLRTDVVAWGLGGGLAVTLTDAIEMRITGRYDQYSHTFTPTSSSQVAADGGTDRYYGATVSAVYFYR